MRIVLLITSILFISFQVSGAPFPSLVSQINRPVDAAREAELLWAQVIAAKGGRERLYAVKNMVLSSRINYRKNLFIPVELHFEELYEFPAKHWMWADERESGVFGITVEMVNLERKLSYLSYPNDPASPRKLEIYPRDSEPIFEAQLVYLTESQWLKPIPVSKRIERIGLQRFDVVQTLVNGKRFDFFLDRKRHLPVRVVEHYSSEVDPRGEWGFILGDYVNVKGIEMPQSVIKFEPLRRVKYEVKQQVNVEFNKEIFERPPSIEAGPGAWKIKAKSVEQ